MKAGIRDSGFVSNNTLPNQTLPLKGRASKRSGLVRVPNPESRIPIPGS